MLHKFLAPFGTVQQTSNISLLEGIFIAVIIFWGIPTIIAIISVKIKEKRKNKKPNKNRNKDEK